MPYSNRVDSGPQTVNLGEATPERLTVKLFDKNSIGVDPFTPAVSHRAIACAQIHLREAA
jgi:hypothetical protein